MAANIDTPPPKKTLTDIAKEMRDIDFTLMSTIAEDGSIATRPMSNNRDVEFDGDSYFFTDEVTTAAKDLARDPTVGLSLQGKAGWLGKPPIFITIEGRAELIRDRIQFRAHWHKGLELWWDGPDAPGIVLIKVHADRIHYWDGLDEGEVKAPPGDEKG